MYSELLVYNRGPVSDQCVQDRLCYGFVSATSSMVAMNPCLSALKAYARLLHGIGSTSRETGAF